MTQASRSLAYLVLFLWIPAQLSTQSRADIRKMADGVAFVLRPGTATLVCIGCPRRRTEPHVIVKALGHCLSRLIRKGEVVRYADQDCVQPADAAVTDQFTAIPKIPVGPLLSAPSKDGAISMTGGLKCISKELTTIDTCTHGLFLHPWFPHFSSTLRVGSCLGAPRTAHGAGKHACGRVVIDKCLRVRIPFPGAFQLLGNDRQMSQ